MGGQAFLSIAALQCLRSKAKPSSMLYLLESPFTQSIHRFLGLPRGFFHLLFFLLPIEWYDVALIFWHVQTISVSFSRSSLPVVALSLLVGYHYSSFFLVFWSLQLLADASSPQLPINWTKILIFNIFFEKNKKLPLHTDETLHVPKWPVFWVVAQHLEKLLVTEVFILSTTLLFFVCKHSLVCLKFSTIYAPVLCQSSHYCPQVYFVLFGSRLVWFRESLLSGPRQI